MTVFGLKSGQDLGNRAAHPHQEFAGVPPGSSIFKDMNTENTNINNKGLQRTANECAVERRIYKDLISKNECRTWTPGPWTPSWIRTMDYPCGLPLIFEDKFYQKSKQVLGTLKWTKLWSALIIRVMGSSYLPWSQRFFLIFLRERDQGQAAKRRQRVAKATRREKNLWLPWPRISLSCRRQGQDLTLGR